MPCIPVTLCRYLRIFKALINRCVQLRVLFVGIEYRVKILVCVSAAIGSRSSKFGDNSRMAGMRGTEGDIILR